jgi:crotonobetainyl-CoA:carnitine CoA-transferase CaiB-like acyl-CoA transferase
LSMSLAKPFEGLCVVELASVLAGPAVGMFFAELGAEVIKVEHRSAGGDMTRKWKLPSEEAEASVSAYFSAMNYRKQYVDLDLDTESAQTTLTELLGKADIVINNMKSTALDRFNLQPPTLREMHPALIIAQLDGFANDDGRLAFDAVLQAECGYLSMTGSPEQKAKMPVAFIDILAAHQLKEGILIALLERAKDGQGAIVRTNLEQTAISSLANQASNYLMTSHVASAQGTLHPNIAPYGEIVSTKEGKEFILAIGTDKQFNLLCSVLELDCASDPLFLNNRERVVNRKALHEVLLSATKRMDAEHFYEACIKGQVPVGRVRNIDEVLRDSTATDMVRKETIEGLPTARITSIAFDLSR